MGSTLSDAAKLAINMVIICAVIVVIVAVAMKSHDLSDGIIRRVDTASFVDHAVDLESMALYGDKLPMPNVVSALELYGEPLVFCLQMEDLKWSTGVAYPVAKAGTSEMTRLLGLLKNYYGKEVYVYTYKNNSGELQLCVSELEHVEGSDGSLQNWSE